MLNRKGFTMVELLVVLVIIAILAAVATPIYLANTQRAKMSEAIATMSLIRQAQRDFKVNNNSFFDVAEDTTTPDNTTGHIQLPIASSVVIATGVPTPNPSGVNLSLGVTQYFSNGAFFVQTDATQATLNGFSRSGLFTNPGVVGMLVSMKGTHNYKCAATADTQCAVKGDQTTTFEAEMDDSGRTFVCYDTCGTAANWSAY